MACPEVVLLKKHILVMSFIGHDQVPAPTLKEAPLTRTQFTSAYQQCIQVSQICAVIKPYTKVQSGVHMHVKNCQILI